MFPSLPYHLPITTPTPTPIQLGPSKRLTHRTVLHRALASSLRVYMVLCRSGHNNLLRVRACICGAAQIWACIEGKGWPARLG